MLAMVKHTHTHTCVYIYTHIVCLDQVFSNSLKVVALFANKKKLSSAVDCKTQSLGQEKVAGYTCCTVVINVSF